VESWTFGGSGAQVAGDDDKRFSSRLACVYDKDTQNEAQTDP
jgi:hypothetical protein